MGRLLPEAVLSPIEATCLAWVDISRCGSPSSEVYRCCLERGVIPLGRDLLGKAAGEGFMRLNFACPAERLAEGLKGFRAP